MDTTNTDKTLSLHDYLAIAVRRKWYLIIPLVISIVISSIVYYYLPKAYKATTLIMVSRQKVPDRFVPSTIEASLAERISSISLEILSRSRLENIIKEFNLFTDIQGKASMDEVIERMRKIIDITPEGRGRPGELTAFSISFEGAEPKKVMMVTNKLASLFIEENLKVRESLSEGTSEFIRRELQAAEENLKKKEQEIRNYNEKFMGKLPSQVDSNMRVLDRLDDRLNSVAGNIMDKERRSSNLQIQIEQLKRPKPALIQVESSWDKQLDKEIKEIEEAMQQPEKAPDDPLINQAYTLKKDLTNAQMNYTDRHPDVIALKSKIAQLEPKVYERMRGLEKQQQEKIKLDKTRRERLQELKARRDKIIGANKGKVVGLDPETEKVLSRLTGQYDELQWEMKKLRTEEKELRNKMAVYQRKVEEVPKREEELLSLTRDYDLLKGKYQSLLSKQMEAKMAENLEQKQQGEQFKILDPARLPGKPIRPKVEQILLAGIAIGLFAGIGLTWFRESLDQSFHSEADLEAHLGLPILAVIPNLKEEDKTIKA